MKLIIQIPCLNEAQTIELTINSLPKKVEGFDEVEILVIDDGSVDGTAASARAAGATHIIRHTRNLGLARAFETGLATSLRLGADVIVNTDADNQYCGDDIPLLTNPILAGTADMVIGERPISSIRHFSMVKRMLQKFGSAVIRLVSGTDVRDAPSGFRSFSRSAAQKLHIFNDYTYTLETIIQAGQKGIAAVSVPIRVNGQTRESRLIKSIPNYIRKSIGTIFRILITYRPMRFFCVLAIAIATPGVLLGLRFLYYYVTGSGQGMVQSLLLAALLVGVGCTMCVVGILADLIASNRKLLERLNMTLQQIGDQISAGEGERK